MWFSLSLNWLAAGARSALHLQRTHPNSLRKMQPFLVQKWTTCPLQETTMNVNQIASYSLYLVSFFDKTAFTYPRYIYSLMAALKIFVSLFSSPPAYAPVYGNRRQQRRKHGQRQSARSGYDIDLFFHRNHLYNLSYPKKILRRKNSIKSDQSQFESSSVYKR